MTLITSMLCLMVCLELLNSDPFFCLAAEEFLLKNYADDIFLLWKSDNVVVIGKHQNTLAEINYRFVRENNINIARRISGGGTVFNDGGNVNFSFIKKVSGPSEISFKKFTLPVTEFLRILGVKAETSGRNDLVVSGKKISGNAQHIYKNRVLHHGTLLFDSDLKKLGEAIRVVPGKYIGKAVQSNRSEVTNIRPCLKNDMDTERFAEFLFNYQMESDPENTVHNFDDAEIRAITKLGEEKFSTWEWLFGYSPGYTFQNESVIDNKILKIELRVEKGVITESCCTGEVMSFKNLNHFNQLLSGKRHLYEDIYEVARLFFPLWAEEKAYDFF